MEGLKSPRTPRKTSFKSPKKSPTKKKLETFASLSPLKRSLPTNCYQKAKQVLNTGRPEKVICRDAELAEINDFLKKTVQKKKPGSLYISGPPGTGKTAALSTVIAQLFTQGRKVLYINCMASKNSQAIFNRLHGDLNGKESSLTPKEATAALQKSFTSKGEPVVLVLDEIDSLDSKNQEILYTAFEWPHLPKSRLVLIGIANSLDLVDRILPRLKSRPEMKPQLLNFAPYTKDQIVEILMDRLSSLDKEECQCLDGSAVQLCARKVAAVAGDMRKALDICRRAVELVEGEVQKPRVLQTITQSPMKAGAVPRKITAAQILRVTTEVDASRTSGSNNAESVPLQQKITLCTLLLMVKDKKTKEVVLGKLHDEYKKVASRQKLPVVDQGEFLSICSLADTRGLVVMKKGKDTRSTKIRLSMNEQELENAIQDKTLMSSILELGLVK